MLWLYNTVRSSSSKSYWRMLCTSCSYINLNFKQSVYRHWTWVVTYSVSVCILINLMIVLNYSWFLSMFSTHILNSFLWIDNLCVFFIHWQVFLAISPRWQYSKQRPFEWHKTPHNNNIVAIGIHTYKHV